VQNPLEAYSTDLAASPQRPELGKDYGGHDTSSDDSAAIAEMMKAIRSKPQLEVKKKKANTLRDYLLNLVASFNGEIANYFAKIKGPRLKTLDPNWERTMAEESAQAMTKRRL
jgi:hypothetical protein